MGVRVNVPVQVRNVCATEYTCMSQHTSVSLQWRVHTYGHMQVCMCVPV